MKKEAADGYFVMYCDPTPQKVRLASTAGHTDGGMALYTLATLTVLGAALSGERVTNALLGRPTLRWLGRVSYGAYVYHWPIYLWLTPERTGLGDLARLHGAQQDDRVHAAPRLLGCPWLEEARRCGACEHCASAAGRRNRPSSHPRRARLERREPSL